MPTNPNDVNFLDNIKRIIGSDANDVEKLIPKIDPDILIDLAAAVTNGNRKEVLELLRIGRQKTMGDVKEDKLISKKKSERKPKEEKTTLLDHEFPDLNVGDAVIIEKDGENDDDENGEEGTVKLPKAPGNTVGVMLKGKLKMINRKDVKLKEGVLGMTNIPDIQRMRELAGIAAQDLPEPVKAPEAPPVVEPPEQIEIDMDSEECGMSALALLDQLACMLPELRLADISAVRKRITDIQTQLNESVNGKKLIEGRNRKG